MDIYPLSNKVAIQPTTEEKKTVGGILLVDTKDEKTQTGVVVATGYDAEQVIRGETVIFPKGIGIEFNIDGVDYIMLNENDILAAIETK